MNMPGFTAEASLYQTNHRSFVAEHSNERGRPDAIIPQRPRVLDCTCTADWSICCCRDANGKWKCFANASA